MPLGRLVAWVPTRAGGFTVRAPGLMAWDIGTIFLALIRRISCVFLEGVEYNGGYIKSQGGVDGCGVIHSWIFAAQR